MNVNAPAEEKIMDGLQPETLVALRTLAGLTQTGLAAAFGISRATVARWESGKVAIPKWVELAMRSI